MDAMARKFPISVSEELVVLQTGELGSVAG